MENYVLYNKRKVAEYEKKIEDAKKVIFDDTASYWYKLETLKSLFNRVNDIREREFVESKIDCDDCAYEYDGDCELSECCYLEGSKYWADRGLTKDDLDDIDDSSDEY